MCKRERESGCVYVHMCVWEEEGWVNAIDFKQIKTCFRS